jgi:catechol 2,3-dioxygenase-like lactoylglutathione lyase family enzyme
MPSLAAATPIAFVNVSDREKGVAFYRDTLGLTLQVSDEFGDLFACAGGLIRMTALPGYEPPAYPVFGWEVAAIGDEMAALRDKGIAFTVYEMPGFGPDRIWTAPDGVSKLAWFQDPDGNVLVLSQSG